MHSKTIISLICVVSSLPSLCSSSSYFSACWAFGDVITDTGNNNFIPTYFRSNFRPYGRDFPHRIPTGRFSNGKLPIDFICSGLGFKNLTPPYLGRTSISENELVTGASFSSAGGGYDPLTPVLSSSLNFSAQINLFKKALGRINILAGENMTNSIVENSLFIVTGGVADFALFYDTRIRSLQYNISDYQDFVLHQVESTIRMLYSVGARRLLLWNLPPIGCIPIQKTVGVKIGQYQCIQQQNDDSVAYNRKFQLLLSRLEQVLPNSRIVPNNVYDFTLDAVTNPAKYGFEETRKGCCGTGLFEVGPTCMEPFVATCNDTSKYVFWDAFNPTEKFYKILSDISLQTIHSQFPF